MTHRIPKFTVKEVKEQSPPMVAIPNDIDDFDKIRELGYRLRRVEQGFWGHYEFPCALIRADLCNDE